MSSVITYQHSIPYGLWFRRARTQDSHAIDVATSRPKRSNRVFFRSAEHDPVLPYAWTDRLSETFYRRISHSFQMLGTFLIGKIRPAKPQLVQISTAYGKQQEGSKVLPRNRH
jgi:hypothetical protein